MSSSSQKHQNFVSEPMGDKPVMALPGIGPTLGRVLQTEGVDKASTVLGHYLVLDKNPERFTHWLKHTMARSCIQSLKEWSDNFV